MRIVVTGAAGYVGRPLVERLAAAGHDVVGIDLGAALHTARADVRNLPDALFHGADAVVHLAAVSFAPEWDDIDDLIWDVNVEGTRRVVDHCERAGVRRLVVASSASVFEGRTDPPATISTWPTPLSAYGRSKVECERILATSSIPQRLAVRKGTVCGLGPQPRLDLLTNAMSVAALRQGSVFVDGTGCSRRPILRLERAVAGYVSASTNELPLGMHVVNLCDDNVTVIDVATQICGLTGARLVLRTAQARPRSYCVFAGRSAGFDLPDLPALDATTIVRGVVLEARARLDELPEASDDPRVDRLAAIRNSVSTSSAGVLDHVSDLWTTNRR